jgi:hypothetical protein
MASSRRSGDKKGSQVEEALTGEMRDLFLSFDAKDRRQPTKTERTSARRRRRDDPGPVAR